MKNVKKLLGIIVMVALVGFGFTACGEEEEDGVKFNITNNHTAAIKSVRVKDTKNEFNKDISIAANGGKGSVTFNLEKSPIGYPVTSFKVTFTDDTEAYSSNYGQFEKTIEVTVTEAGNSGVKLK